MLSRPARTLGIIAALGVVAVVSLSYIAQRYSKVLEGQSSSVLGARQEVDQFIQVRRGMRQQIDSWKGGPPRQNALTATRDRALLLHGVDPESYAEVRRQYRAWREGKLGAGTPLAAALERRKDELGRLDQGAYEPLDT